MIYRASEARRVGEVFGLPVVQSNDLHLFRMRNRENELVINDAATAKEKRHYNFDSPVRFAAFPAARSVLVLTADQKVHTLPFESGDTRFAGAAK